MNADAEVDVAIVGGGPGGMTAATYLGRFLRHCIVIDAGDSRARYIPESHNCPGFPQGVAGVELLRRMRMQAEAYGASVSKARVNRIEARAGGFTLSSDARQWQARLVILATGLADRLPDVPWAADAIACGALRLCAICDAFEARDRRIGVHGPGAGIGGHASFLRAYSSQVSMLPSDNDVDHPAIDEARQQGARLLPGGGRLTFDGTRCSYQLDGQAPETFDTIYPYLGYRGRNALLRGLDLDMRDDGELAVDSYQRTGVPGIYAIGDAVSGLNQISVAVGQAAVAATHAHNALPFVPRD